MITVTCSLPTAAGCGYSSFSASALTFWIPKRIISLRFLFSFSQQKSKSSMVCLSALIFSCMSFGFSAFGLPVRGDTSSPTFCVHANYISVYTKSQALFLNIVQNSSLILARRNDRMDLPSFGLVFCLERPHLLGGSVDALFTSLSMPYGDSQPFLQAILFWFSR